MKDPHYLPSLVVTSEQDLTNGRIFLEFGSNLVGSADGQNRLQGHLLLLFRGCGLYDFIEDSEITIESESNLQKRMSKFSQESFVITIPGVNFTNILRAAFLYEGFFVLLLCAYNLGL